MKSTESFLRNIPGLSFVAILFVLLIHCRLGAGVSSASSSFWAEELLVNGFARVAVPLFFFISGFLFFLKWDGSAAKWMEKLRRRVRSLLVPYLICSAVAIAITWIMVRAHISSDDSITHWGLSGFLRHWLWDPQAFHLWFLRELMLFGLLAWLWYKLPRPAKWILLALVGAAWLQDWDPIPAFGGQAARALEGLLFYFLGAILAIDQRYDEHTFMERVLNQLARLQIPLALAWCAFTVSRFILIHQYGVSETPLMLLLYKLAIFIGTAFILGFGAKDRSIFSPARDTTFFIYLYHLPLCLYARTALERFLGSESLVFFGAFIIALAVPWITSLLLQKFAPKPHSLLTGGR